MAENEQELETQIVEYMDGRTQSVIKFPVTQVSYNDNGVNRLKFKFSDFAQSYEIRRLEGDLWEQISGDLTEPTLQEIGSAIRNGFRLT